MSKKLLASGAAISCLGLTALGCSDPPPSEQAGGMALEASTTAPATPSSGASDRPNHAPVIDRVSISPSEAQIGTALEVHVEASDPDGDAIEYRYRWTVGGNRVADGRTFRVQNVSKGDDIEVVVIAKDAQAESAPASARTRVANQPPILLGAVIEPLGEIAADHDVTAVPRSKDLDGDPVTHEIAWRVNGRTISTNRPTLPSKWYKRGDQIEFTVTAFDGTDASQPLTSDPITVANSAPVFTSTPTGLDAEGVFRYRPAIADPDGDRSIRFRLVDSPRGMRLDAASGEVSWTPLESQTGAFPVELEVDDRNGGVVSQKFTLTVGAGETAPAKLQ